MAVLNVSLPDDLGEWARARAAEGCFADPADYVRDTMQREREYQDKLARLQAAIDEGLASGVSDRDPFEYIDELRARLRGHSGSADAA